MTRRAPASSRSAKGLTVPRRWTAAGRDPFASVPWERRSSLISDSDGGAVFKMDDVEVPKAWTQLATDIAASKYLRRTGVPGTGHETGVRQLFERVAVTIREAGESLGGYFAAKADAQAFEDELKHMLVNQIGAFNSPVFFNVGLKHRYGIEGHPGNWRWNPATDHVEPARDAYSHPQASACFIQSVDDTLSAIFDLSKNEARIFKYGSGSGTNFSRLRSRYERLSTGGSPSGLMFFLEVLDKGAGAIKSGGVARKSAKMVCLDMDHPEIVDFVQWKMREEKKVAVLIAAGYPSDFNGEAYRTVSGQNSNNSVRVTDEFMRAAENNDSWTTTLRSTGKPHQTLEARKLLGMISQAAWACGDPGVQFDSTINAWHTCPRADRIRASNPCSEFMFLDDTACNLASLNLLKFLGDDNRFDVEAYRHAADVFFLAQEILVDFSSYPTQKIAQNSHDYRPLGLGYANLGTLLMVLGVPYDSPEAVATCGALTAILTGRAYLQSARIAKHKGAFAGYERNGDAMLGVIAKHRAKVEEIDQTLALDGLVDAAREDWAAAFFEGERWGYRNAQATVLAPTGTIGLLMGCDTTGIEPDFSLIKVKKLAGGGTIVIANESVPRALRALGYSDADVKKISEHIVKTGGVDGAPGLKAEHLPVFDCANPCGTGTRFIAPLGHVRMMAAAQPFISGAISKTVNAPHKTTTQEIESIYVESWKLGLKAISVYRDGCKLSQPVSVSGQKEETAAQTAAVKTAQAVLERRWLPQRRRGFTQELRVGGQKFYLRTGEYENGTLGEFFIDGGKSGSPLQGMLSAFATACSLALQYGVPLEELVDRFAFTRFEPSGPVSHPYVKNATSPVDLIARVLGVEYLGRDDLAHVKPPKLPKKPAKTAAPAAKTRAATAAAAPSSAISRHLSGMMGDAPLCDTCGHITVRNATCYKCLNCGNSMGCS
ncbi:MAG: vitamin B12-dependent ribonucleotide reductase [Elusimicrobiota bacterium]